MALFWQRIAFCVYGPTKEWILREERQTRLPVRGTVYFWGTGSNREANNSEQIFGILCEWCIKLESRKRCRFSETEGNCIDF